MIISSTSKTKTQFITKTKNSFKKDHLIKKNVNFKSKSQAQKKITTKFLVGTDKPTFLYYLYTLRKRELESKKKFKNSFLTQFKNSYKWTHFFLQKVNSSSLRKFYIAKKPFFRHSFFGRSIYNKYISNLPLLWIAKNRYWKIPLYKIHELLGIKIKRHLLSSKTNLSYKFLNNNLISFFNLSTENKKISFFSFLVKIKSKKILKPYSFFILLNTLDCFVGFFNFFSNINFYEKNKLISKRALKFPINFLVSKKYPSFLIVNYNIFSFCITKNLLTTPSFQLKLFLRNFIYYPIWYKSSFIY